VWHRRLEQFDSQRRDGNRVRNCFRSCKNASFFERFPYVCPEPVLAKRSF
jgi:hypothetical protein